MTNQTKIEVGSIEDLKDLVRKTIGSNLDGVVIKDEKLPSGQFNVSKVSTDDFLSIAREYLSSGNIAVVTAEDMNKPGASNLTNKKPKMK